MFRLLQRVWVIDEMQLKEGVITGVDPDPDESRFEVSTIDRYKGSSTRLNEFNSYKSSSMNSMNSMGLFADKTKAKAHLIKLLRKTLDNLEEERER